METVGQCANLAEWMSTRHTALTGGSCAAQRSLPTYMQHHQLVRGLAAKCSSQRPWKREVIIALRAVTYESFAKYGPFASH